MHRKLTWLLWGLLGIHVFYAVSGVLNFQIESVDVLGIWLFKAKAIYVEGGFPLQTLKDPDFFLAHSQYPLLMPAVYAGFYFLMGQVWELPILLLYPLYYVVVLFLVYKVIRDLQLTQLQSLTFVYIYSMFSPLLGQAGRGHAGSADILIVLMAWIVIRILQTQATRPSWQTLLMTVVIVWMSSQIKLEGLFLCAAILCVTSSFSSKFTALLMCLVPYLIWNIMLANYAIQSDFTFAFPGGGAFIWRCWLILRLTFQEMLNFRNWYLFWPLVLVGGVIDTSKPSSFIYALKLLLLLITGGYVWVYLTVTTDVTAHITSSIDRVLLHLTPWIFPIFVFNSKNVLEDLVSSFPQKSRLTNKSR